MWRRISGAPKPSDPKAAEELQMRLVGCTVDVLCRAESSTKCYQCHKCLREVMQLSATYGRSAALRELLRRAAKHGSAASAWSSPDNQMLLLLSSAVTSSAASRLETVGVVLNDLVESVLNECFDSRRADSSSVWSMVNELAAQAVADGDAVLYTPNEITLGIFFNAVLGLYNLSPQDSAITHEAFHKRIFTAVRACTDALVSGACTSRAVLDGIIEHLISRVPSQFVEVCLLQVTNVLMKRNMPESLCTLLGSRHMEPGLTYLAVAGILGASTDCMHVILRLPGIEQVHLTPAFMRVAVMRASDRVKPRRLAELLRFWASSNIEGCADATRDALTMLVTSVPKHNGSAACVDILRCQLIRQQPE